MIASTMLYLAAASVAASAAALVADAGLRRLDAPRRWAWLGAMILPGALLLSRTAVGHLQAPSPIVAPIPLPGLTIGGGDASSRSWAMLVEAVLTTVWVVGSTVLAGMLARGQWVLARERRATSPRVLYGHRVHVTPRRGPAVAGFVHPWIAVPDWVLALPDEQVRMVVAHEAEHVVAGDARVLGVGLAVVATTFWNPLAWWQLGRLRAAVELDCDRRVLAAGGDARVYGIALLAVAAGAVPERSLGLAAFSENAHALRTRIIAMTSRRARWARPVGAVLLLAAAALGVQACGLDSPVAPVGQNRNTPPAQAATDGPYFTPFTIAPQLTNRDEVRAALEREYPRLLRDAGVAGRADVWLRIEPTGDVTDVRVKRTTGHPALDQAAIKVGETMKFTAAENRGEKVMAWVSVPITFAVR